MKAGSGEKAPKWHYLYYLLATFDIITIALSLRLNHQILASYEKSIELNSRWLVRLEAFDKISTLASLVNAPGNDVFDSHNPGLERERKHKALVSFKGALEKAQDEAGSILNFSHSKQLLEQINKINSSMDEMDGEAELIFKFFEKGDSESAGKRMATMDRRFAKLNFELATLRRLSREFVVENFSSQTAQARDMSRFEYLIALLILCIVAVVAFYGHWLNKKIIATNKLIESQKDMVASSARLASMGTMAASIAHEINNPLAIIQGQAKILIKKLQNESIGPELILIGLQKVVKTSDRITAIVRGLRSFSRDGYKDTLEPVDVMRIFEDSTSFCRERFTTSGIELRVTPPDLPLSLSCREVQICQVIVNLLNNAFDAVSGFPNAWVELSSAQKDDKLLIRVTDSGKGLSKEILSKIMTPFFTTKEPGKGTGLGLSISREIIESHGGRFYVDEKSSNTSFVIELPFEPPLSTHLKTAA